MPEDLGAILVIGCLVVGREFDQEPRRARPGLFEDHRQRFVAAGSGVDDLEGIRLAS